MKKNKRGKRYFEFKNRVAYIVTHKRQFGAYLFPTIYVNPLEKPKDKEDWFQYTIIELSFLFWNLTLVFEDKQFKEFIH